jgi:hypothetical protein
MTPQEFINPGVGETKETQTDMGFNSAGILIGVPMCGRDLSNKWGVYFAMQDAGTNMSKTILPSEGLEVGVARQMMAEASISREHDTQGGDKCVFCQQKPDDGNCASRPKFEWLWFVDDDVIVPPQSLRELLDKATKIRAHEEIKYGEAKTVAIGGIYCTKEKLSTPVAYRKLGNGPSWNWIRGMVFDVEGIGTGCLLIHTSIFHKLEKPWFKTVDEDHVDESNTITHVNITDDLYFCRKVKAAGYNIVAHGGILCGHYDYKTRKMYKLPDDCPPNLMAAEIEKDPSLEEVYLKNIAAREAEAAAYTAVPPASAGNTSASV